MPVTIYSDGGADPNPGIGGWAAILRSGEHEKVLSGNDPQTTNNRMELTAAVEALKALKRPSVVDFYTDSQYVRRGITEWIEGWAAKGWVRGKGTPVPNADLWQALWAQVKAHDIEWHWVKGHAGDRDNERVDELARRARLAITPPETLATDLPRLFVRASCLGNPGPGGWGVVLVDGDESEQLSGAATRTTNNRMELQGVLEGLRHRPPGTVQVVTTSDYVFQGATRWLPGWRRRQWRKKGGQPIANDDLWQALDALLADYDVRWINGKSRADDALNIAGQLAAAAARSA